MKIFDVEPRVAGAVHLGSNKRESTILAGRMSEKGNRDPIYFDASENFVVLEVGKRGSGKSYGMGAMLEGFATRPGSRISTHADPRAVVLLDPLDVHWTALTPLSSEGPEGLVRQHRVYEKWPGLTAEPINTRVFVPAGMRWDIDPPEFRELRVPVSTLEAGDWALLIKADLMADTRGRLFDEAFRKVTELGWAWDDPSAVRAPTPAYTVQDLVDCIDHDPDIAQFYASETRRSVVQPLRSFGAMALFDSAAGTLLTEIAEAGVLSIVSLGRLSDDMRTVLTTVLVRLIKADRMYASQIRRRLALIRNTSEQVAQLETELLSHVPRTVLAIDEAQILMPARGASTARKTLDSFVLEGRNYGLSLWLATQRPKGAVSEAAASQIDTFIIHRLSVAEDVSAVCAMLQNAQPDKVRAGGRDLPMTDLIRSLDVGQALFSSATSDAHRLVIGEVRPRNVAHGGEAF
ncbi:MAG: ATP-binding protein [Phenylobacterium sp.]|nr:MAG: ATP-binding protein [Phenylobacterium sp.]